MQFLVDVNSTQVQSKDLLKYIITESMVLLCCQAFPAVKCQYLTCMFQVSYSSHTKTYSGKKKWLQRLIVEEIRYFLVCMHALTWVDLHFSGITNVYLYTYHQLAIPAACRRLLHPWSPTGYHTLCPRSYWSTPPLVPLALRHLPPASHQYRCRLDKKTQINTSSTAFQSQQFNPQQWRVLLGPQFFSSVPPTQSW